MNWRGVPNSTAATRTLTLTGHDEEAYRYQVRAFGRAGGGTASNAQQIDLLPDMPDNFQGLLSVTSTSQANLTWDDPGDPSITAYEYRIAAGDLAAIAGDGQVTLKWASPGDNTITGWEYRQKVGQGNYGSLDEHPEQQGLHHVYTVTGLDNNKTYSFRVRALKPNAETPLAAVDRWRLGNVGATGR